MHLKITKIDKYSFNDAATLIAASMAETSVQYTRSQAVAFLAEHGDTTIVLTINEATMGVYSYTDDPNIYILNFFALNPLVRRKTSGYSLYKDMAERLKDKPVIAPVHTENSPMINVVKSRGVFLGRFPSVDGLSLDYYSINFQDKKEWE